MEIEVENVSYNRLKNLSCTIFSNKINCIIGDESKEDMFDLLVRNVEYSGTILVANDVNGQIDELSFVDNKPIFKYKSINMEFSSFLNEKGYDKDNIARRVKESLKIVGMEDKKNKFIEDLSTGEKILLRLAMALSSKFKLLVINDIFDYLDKDTKLMIANIIDMLRLKYNKTIVIISNDVDYMYPLSDNYIVIKSGELLARGSKDIFYKELILLDNNDVDIPQIVRFSALAKSKKDIKLRVRTNIKDLMKDIYRSV